MSFDWHKDNTGDYRAGVLAKEYIREEVFGNRVYEGGGTRRRIETGEIRANSYKKVIEAN